MNSVNSALFIRGAGNRRTSNTGWDRQAGRESRPMSHPVINHIWIVVGEAPNTPSPRTLKPRAEVWRERQARAEAAFAKRTRPNME